MKRYYTSFTFLLLFGTIVSLHAQDNSVAIGSNTVKSNAVLWLNGNGSQGLLLPSVGNTSNVSGPDAGMVVYQTSDNRVYYFNGSTWLGVGGPSVGGAGYSLRLQGTNLELLADGTVQDQIALTSFTVGGDLSGNIQNASIVSLNGIALPNGTPNTNQILVYNGTSWSYQDVPTGTFSGVFTDATLTGNGTAGAPLTVASVDDADADPSNELQNLSLSGTVINIEGATGVDLAPIIPPGGTDDQNLVLAGDVLSIEGGTGSVDLSTYRDDADADPTNENQSLSLSGTTLNISNGSGVDLAPIIPPGGTDDQNLVLTGDVLSIEGGIGSVDLSTYIDDADSDPVNEIQNLSLSGTQINIEGGSGVDIGPLIPPGGTDDQTAAEVLYDNSISGLSSTDVKGAIDELAGSPGGTDDQNLILTGDVLSIEGGAGSVDLSTYVDDADADPTNENQDLSLTGTTLNITNGTGVDLAPIIPPGGTDDQNLVLTGDVLSIEGGAGSVDLSTYIDDADADPTNENQDLSLTGTTLNITNGTGVDLAPIIPPGGTDDQNLILIGDVLSIEGGTGSVDLSTYVDDADADPTNENQDLSLTGTTLNITNGTGVDLAPIIPPGGTDDQNLVLTGDVLSIEGGGGSVDLSTYVDDADADPINEIQNLSLSGNTINISGGTGVDLTPIIPIDTDNQTAAEVTYDNSTSGLTSTDVKSAIDEIAASGVANQDLDFTAGIITLSDDPTPTSIDLSAYDANASDDVLLTTPATNNITGDFATGFSIASDAITSINVVDESIISSDIQNGTIATIDIASGGIDQVLTTDAAGTVTWEPKGSLGGNQNLQQVLTQGNDAGASAITNLADPTAAQDAATRNYVDTQIGAVAAFPPLSDLQIIQSSGADNPIGVTVGGALSVGAGGVFSINNDVVTGSNIADQTISNGDISLTADIDVTKLAAPGGTDKGVLITNGTNNGWLTTANANRVFGTDLSNTLVGRPVILSTAAAVDNSGIRAVGTAEDANLVSEAAVAEALAGIGGFNTLNEVPRGDGTGLVSSNIQSDGTNVGIGAVPPASSRLVVQASDLETTARVGNNFAGAGTNTGVRADVNGSTNQNVGVYGNAFSGDTAIGLFGSSGTSTNAYGVFGTVSGAGVSTAYGLFGNANSPGINYGVFGSASGGTNNYAGYFTGDLVVTGAIGLGGSEDFGTSGQVLTSQGLGTAPVWTDLPGGSGWSLAGNAGTTAGTDFIGTTDTAPLEIKVDNTRVYRFELDLATAVPSGPAPNIIGGSDANLIAAGVVGGTISGGGRGPQPNVIEADGHFNTIGGGRDNIVGGDFNNTIAGGSRNDARGNNSFIGGGIDNVSTGFYTAVAGGIRNQATGRFSTVAGGRDNLATDVSASVLGGESNVADGQFATSVGGARIRANSVGLTVVGTANVEDLSYSATTWVPTDPIFIVGNGEIDPGNQGIDLSRSNAMTVLKNGTSRDRDNSAPESAFHHKRSHPSRTRCSKYQY